MSKTPEELNEMIERILQHLECIDDVVESLIKRIGSIEYYISVSHSKYIK
jgi:hypothetical protein